MKKIIFGLFLASISSLSLPAKADDPFAYTGGPTSSSIPGSWEGGYLGLNAGIGWGTAGTANTSGLSIGAHGGKNWQYDKLVYGLEGDLTYSDVKFKGFTNTFAVDWMGTLRARGGFTYEKFLFYGTGGLGVGSKEYKDITGSDRAYSIGWVAGAGVEAKITPRIGVRAEYLHTDLGADTFTTGLGKTNLTSKVNTIRAATQVHF